jgi:hypothetical protein
MVQSCAECSSSSSSMATALTVAARSRDTTHEPCTTYTVDALDANTEGIRTVHTCGIKPFIDLDESHVVIPQDMHTCPDCRLSLSLQVRQYPDWTPGVGEPAFHYVKRLCTEGKHTSWLVCPHVMYSTPGSSEQALLYKPLIQPVHVGCSTQALNRCQQHVRFTLQHEPAAQPSSVTPPHHHHTCGRIHMLQPLQHTEPPGHWGEGRLLQVDIFTAGRSLNPG